MKKFGKFLSVGMIALALGACSSEEPLNPGNQGQVVSGAKDVYASLTLRLPSAGYRAGNNGEEVGQSYENSVGKVLVVLATKNADGQYTYLAHSESDAKPNTTNVPAGTVKYVLNFSSDDMTPNPLDKPTSEGTENGGSYIPGSTPVYVFAYCNPTGEIVTYFEDMSKGTVFTESPRTISDKDNANIWTANKFLMTNCEIAEVDGGLPARDVLVDEHSTPETALNLGTVKVKRVAARFDFMSTETEAGVNMYEIKDIDGETVVGTVELTDMAMFNIAKRYYALPHTNSSWTWGGKTTICGDLEGYVMSPGSWRNAESLSASVGDNFFTYLIGRNPETGYTWTSIRNWNKQADNDEGWTPSEGTDYRIWRYTTENTIPGGTGGATSSQKIGITTGVVFKGEFNPVNKQRWNGNVVYVHNNIVYGDFNALRDYVKKYPESTVAADFDDVQAFKDAADDVDLKSNLVDADAKANGFKAYEANAEGKYIMYYFYYNRHNTNDNASLLGHNEFGVVRNNVYKLKVTKVGSFGEPEFPDDPNVPDEEEHAYFTVSCLVMPWTVRVNDIEF